ncbi:MAG: N-acetylmuramoyl-L-alanine amidase [Actinomycetota bacterium]|nr:N-acetylmuramoyl-L-alanine amidase [Actinomycetota bacterium]
MTNFPPRSRLERCHSRRRRRRSLTLFTALCLLVLFGLVAFQALAFSQTRVPRCTEKDLKEAKSLASSAKLKISIAKEVFSETHPEGTVISQEPAGGSRVRKGSLVKVVVSKGSRPIKVEPVALGVGKDVSPEVSSETTSTPPTAGTSVPVLPTPAAPPPSTDSTSTETSVTTPPTVGGKVICIDPGHQAKANLEREPIGPGSSQTKEKCRGGATGVSSGTPEHRITLKVGLKLRALLEKKGVTVVMTRETHDVDISNIERAKIANEAGAHLFVRIHHNGSSNPSLGGVCTLYPANASWTVPIHASSRRAAQLVQRELAKSTGLRDNGIYARSDITGFNWSEVPVVLTEIGFLSNPEEDRLLNTGEFQDKAAQGLFNGIVEYLDET